MKYRFIILLFISCFCFGQAFAQEPVLVTGKAATAVYDKVKAYQVVEGRPVEIASATPKANGQFALAFFANESGHFILGSEKNTDNRYLLYLSPGEKQELNLERREYELSSAASAENKMLKEWFDISAVLRHRAVASTYVDFFPDLENVVAAAQQLKAKYVNHSFSKQFSQIIDYDLANLAIGFLYSPKSVHPQEDELSAYYQSFNADAYLKDDLLQFPYADRLLSMLVLDKVDASTRPSLDEIMALIPSDKLKGLYLMQRLPAAKAYADVEEMMSKYGQYLYTDHQRTQAEQIRMSLIDTKPGAAMIPFSFPDREGKMWTNDDWKGKVVVLDLWATWCGPCKGEEPYWETLTEDFKDKDVVFVGISIDKDKAAWEKYVVEKELKGVQLHAGPRNELSKAYSVSGIPRYMVMDKDGSVVTTDSPRPSNPKLKELLNSLL